jgi:hypothetical protein
VLRDRRSPMLAGRAVVLDARDKALAFPDFDLASRFLGESGGHVQRIEIVAQGAIVPRQYPIGVIDTEYFVSGQCLAPLQHNRLAKT